MSGYGADFSSRSVVRVLASMNIEWMVDMALFTRAQQAVTVVRAVVIASEFVKLHKIELKLHIFLKQKEKSKSDKDERERKRGRNESDKETGIW